LREGGRKRERERQKERDKLVEDKSRRRIFSLSAVNVFVSTPLLFWW
jgi:hypothetical protein